MPTKPGYAGKEMRPAPIDTETSSTNAKTTSPLFPQASGSVRQGTRGKQGMNEGITKEELIQRHMQLQEQFDALQPLNLKLLKDVDKKKKSYMRREIAYKSQISHLKMVLEKTVLCHGSSESDLPATKMMHSEASTLQLILCACVMTAISNYLMFDVNSSHIRYCRF